MAQNGNLNGHKMAKNASNELIFGPDVYFYGFIRFWKDFEKFWKFTDFRPKNDHFARIARRFFGTRFSTENVSSLWKMLQSLSNWVYMYPKVSSTIFRVQNFDFLSSSWKKLGFVDLGGRFWGFLAKNGPLGPLHTFFLLPMFFNLNLLECLHFCINSVFLLIQFSSLSRIHNFSDRQMSHLREPQV